MLNCGEVKLKTKDSYSRELFSRMPAEADLLCEYYISSSLNKKPASAVSSFLNKINQKSTDSASTSTFTADTSTLFESVDFVKYEKNPMDFLKTKYQLLSTKEKVLNGVKQTNGASLSENIKSDNENTQTNNVEMFSSSNWSKINKNGVGLLNLGNNCYLNATLQCLAYTPPLSQWLITKPHSTACKFRQSKGFCSLCEVEKIICDIFQSCNGCAKPNALCFNIKSILKFLKLLSSITIT